MFRTESTTKRRHLIAISLKSKDYSDWVTRGGESFRIATPEQQHPLDGVSGLLLTGGEDVSPDRYGEPNRYCERVNPQRDAFELDLLHTALRQDLPVLAICRGMQLLVVALGGTLYQDLSRELQGDRKASSVVEHRGPGHSDATHEIKIQTGSRLAALIGQDTLLVNSHHHQGVRSLPDELRSAARSPDGLVEAVESPARRFVLGLQWHPERWPDTSCAAIMKAFLAACPDVTGRP